jgi:26S proteasome regulatory subunit T5
MADQDMFDIDEALNQEIMKMSTDDLKTRTQLLNNECKIMRSEHVRIKHEIQTMTDKIKENRDKVKVNKTLPYLVSNVIELLDVDGDDQEEDGANVDLDAQVIT